MKFLVQKTGRVYKIGKRYMEIPHFAFVDIKKWRNGSDKSYDKKFVGTLLLSLTEEEKVADGDFDPDVMDFVKGMKLIWYENKHFHLQKRVTKIVFFCSKLF